MNLKTASAVAAVLTATASSQAYVLITPFPTVSGAGPYEYRYTLSVTEGELTGAANPFASLFALWDIHGYVLGSGKVVTPGSFPLADAAFSIFESTVTAPANSQVVDDPLLYDIAVLYTGAPITDPFGGAPTPFGELVYESTYGPAVFNDGSNFQSLTRKYIAPGDIPGNIEINTLSAFVPKPIPETSTVVAGLGLGLLGAGYVVRRRMQA